MKQKILVLFALFYVVLPMGGLVYAVDDNSTESESNSSSSESSESSNETDAPSVISPNRGANLDKVKKAQEQAEKAKTKREEATAKLEEKKAEVEAKKEENMQKLEAKKAEICEQRASNINKNLETVKARSNTIIENISRAQEKIVAFAQTNNIDETVYADALLMAENEKMIAMKTVEELVIEEVDCSGDNPLGQLTNNKDNLHTANTAIKSYKSAVKLLLETIKTKAEDSTDSADSEESENSENSEQQSN